VFTELVKVPISLKLEGPLRLAHPQSDFCQASGKPLEKSLNIY
jgi:hypothetical protein